MSLLDELGNKAANSMLGDCNKSASDRAAAHDQQLGGRVIGHAAVPSMTKDWAL